VAGEPAEFTAVPWLPPFRLTGRVLSEGVLEVTHPPSALRPLSRLRLDPAGMRFVPEDGAVDGRGAAELAGALAALGGEGTPEARAQRWRLGTALAAAEATAALRRLPDWGAAAAATRRDYLQALDAGRPPAAETLAAACREVPHALRFLGNALPTAEALALLRPLGRICELGAGPGLFARALDRAGMLVAASDPATGSGTGVAFPVRRGFDAAATLAAFAGLGEVPPLLMLWPQPDEGDWFAEVFAGRPPGGLVAMASPEFEFCLAGGLDLATPAELAAAGPGWRAAARLMPLLRDGFEMLGEAPVVPSGWPLAPTPLRLWRRR
jgi:hypothetical protein